MTQRTVSPAEAMNFYDLGMKQFDHLLLGEADAKLATMLGMVSGLNIVLVGEPGGGKTTLAANAHRIVEGIDDEHVAVVPPLADLTGQQLVGGQTEVIKETTVDGKVATEITKTTIQPIVRPDTKVIFANEINRVNPFAINAILEALESGTLVTSEGNTPLEGLEYSISTMNPTDTGQGTFRVSDAAASRHAIGAVMGAEHTDTSQVVSEILGGFEPDPGKMTPAGDLDILHALRNQAREGIAIPVPERDAAGLRIVTILANLRGTYINETPHRFTKHVGLIAKTSALLKGQEATSPDDIETAFRLVVSARLGILGTHASFHNLPTAISEVLQR